MKYKANYLIFFITSAIILFGVIWLLVGRYSMKRSISSLSAIFIALGIISIAFFILDIIEINLKLRKFDNIQLIIKPIYMNKYFSLSFFTFFLAVMSFYTKSTFSIPLGLMLFGLCLHNFSRHASKYYISGDGVFWAGCILLWENVTSYRFNQEKLLLEVNFSCSTKNLSRTMLIPYTGQNKEELKTLLSKHVI